MSQSFLLYFFCGIRGAGTFRFGLGAGTGNISNLGACTLPGVGCISGLVIGAGSVFGCGTGSGCGIGSGAGSILIGSGNSTGSGVGS